MRKTSAPIPSSPGTRTKSPGASVRSTGVSPSASVRAQSPGSLSPAVSAGFASPSTPALSVNGAIPINPALGPSENCFDHFRSFIRVRPWKGKEGSTKPPDQIVPRPALEYNNKALTLLDPKTFKTNFKAAKVNPLETDNVIWSFVDDLETEIERKASEAAGTRVVPQTQDDVYRRVVEPAIPSILEGYGSAFVVLGGNDTGKNTTMFGDEQWAEGGSKGIFPRFVEEIFPRFQQKIRGDTVLKIEVSCVEIPTAAKEEKFIDLLQKKSDQTLRVTDTETEGLILEGSARMKCSNPQDLIECVRKAIKPLRARKSSYAITIHICMTTTYKNLDNPNAPPKVLSRRVAVSFSVIRNVYANAPFARCIDNAVERDTGANSKSKPPTRDNFWTRLFADVFLQKLNVAMITHVSPYYEHIKETAAAMEMTKKLSDIKTYPILRADESEVEYRRLADEIHTLDSEVNNTNQTIDFIQNEIDRCHEEYEAAAADNSEAFENCQRSKVAIKAFNQYKLRETAKGKKIVSDEKAVADALDNDIQNLKAETKATLEATDGIRTERQAADDRIAKITADMDKQKTHNQIYATELEIFTKAEEAVKEKEAFITNSSADYDDAKLALVQEAVALKSETPALKEEAAKAQAEYNEQKEKEDTFAKDLEEQRKKKKEIDDRKAKLAQIKADIAKTLKELEDIEKNIAKKEAEPKPAPPPPRPAAPPVAPKPTEKKSEGGCCVIQ